MGTVEDLGIHDVPPPLAGHVKLEAGDGITLTYDYAHNSIIITKTAAPKLNPGQIGDAVIDTMVFAATTDHRPRIIHIAGDVFAIVDFEAPTNGVLYTVSINGSGIVSDTPISYLIFDSAWGRAPTITHIAGSTYAIAYQGQDYDGWLKTVSIQDNGDIGDAVLDSLEFDTDYANEPSIAKVAGNIYAIAYRGPDSDGWLKTMYIGADGVIGDATIDNFEFDPVRCYTPAILKVASNIFAIAYSGPDNDGWIKTIAVTDAGLITPAAIDSFEFDDVIANEPAFATITDNVFAIAYRGPDEDGWLKTIAIDDDGEISDPALDTLEFDPDDAQYPAIAHIGENIYAIAYQGPDYDGWLKSVSIEVDGTISDAVLDSFEFDTTRSDYPAIITAHHNLVAIAYRHNDLSGRLITVPVDP